MREWSTDVTRPRLAIVGIVVLVVAAVLFVAGLVGVVAGSEVALLPMMFAFGLFTLGFGVVIAARR